MNIDMRRLAPLNVNCENVTPLHPCPPLPPCRCPPRPLPPSSQCFAGVLHSCEAYVWWGWHALKSAFGPMFIGLGTLARFAKGETTGPQSHRTMGGMVDGG